MRTTEIEVILETYDEAINKRQAIISLSKLFDVTPELIIEKLKKNGRTIDINRQKKPERKQAEDHGLLKVEKSKKEEPQEEMKATAKDLPVPEYVKDCLFDKFGQLETKLGELQEELQKTEQEYTLLKNFLFG